MLAGRQCSSAGSAWHVPTPMRLFRTPEWTPLSTNQLFLAYGDESQMFLPGIVQCNYVFRRAEKIPFSQRLRKWTFDGLKLALNRPFFSQPSWLPSPPYAPLRRGCTRISDARVAPHLHWHVVLVCWPCSRKICKVSRPGPLFNFERRVKIAARLWWLLEGSYLIAFNSVSSRSIQIDTDR